MRYQKPIVERVKFVGQLDVIQVSRGKCDDECQV
jgi:hypothetical protein